MYSLLMFPKSVTVRTSVHPNPPHAWGGRCLFRPSVGKTGRTPIKIAQRLSHLPHRMGEVGRGVSRAALRLSPIDFTAPHSYDMPTPLAADSPSQPAAPHCESLSNMPFPGWIAIALGLIVPPAYFGVQGGMNTIFIGLSLVSLGLLIAQRKFRQPHACALSSGDWAMMVALALPITAVAISEAAHHQWQPNALDSPSRFLLAIPILLWLRQYPKETWLGMRAAILAGGLAAWLVLHVAGHDWGNGRMGSSFLNYIHYGDVAALFGVCAIVLTFDKTTQNWLRSLYVVSAAAGFHAALLTGTRSSWMSAAVLLALWAMLRPGRTLYKLLAVAAVVGSTAGLLLFNPTVQQRAVDIEHNITAFSHGNVDTDIGIRFQLWRAAAHLIAEKPIFGWGAHGFKEQMTPLAAQGVVTPLAAQLGRGEVHNQLLFGASNYGLLGGAAGLGLYIVPGWLLWKRWRKARLIPEALTGLMWVIGFFLFGLTVETFDLSMTAALYALSLATLMQAQCTATTQYIGPNQARA